jgi:hypothetical protein
MVCQQSQGSWHVTKPLNPTVEGFATQSLHAHLSELQLPRVELLKALNQLLLDSGQLNLKLLMLLARDIVPTPP